MTPPALPEDGGSGSEPERLRARRRRDALGGPRVVRRNPYGIELADAVAASTRLGWAGIRDEALSRDGRFLYAIGADSQEVYGWAIEEDGSLAPLGAFNGLPATVAGLAAR